MPPERPDGVAQAAFWYSAPPMDLARRSLSGPALEADDLRGLLTSEVPLLPLLHEAWLVRSESFGNRQLLT